LNLSKTQHLLQVMAQLRHPETGCDWDLRQDFQTLTPYILEEAYELVDAIERNDLDDMRSELGDLLLQVVFQSQIAQERGLFDFEQVADGIAEKLVNRHPHVFKGVKFDSDEQRQQAWEEIKATERKNKKPLDDQPESVLDGIATNLPALVFCEKIQDRASQHGFDWPETDPVFDKVKEELHEVHEAWHSGNQAHIEEEVGDLLLVAVNLARHLKVNPEQALKKATKKFSQRFHYIERQVETSGRALRDCQLEELDALWLQAKQHLKNH